MIILGKNNEFTINDIDKFINLIAELKTMGDLVKSDGSKTDDIGEYFESWLQYPNNISENVSENARLSYCLGKKFDDWVGCVTPLNK